MKAERTIVSAYSLKMTEDQAQELLDLTLQLLRPTGAVITRQRRELLNSIRQALLTTDITATGKQENGTT